MTEVDLDDVRFSYPIFDVTGRSLKVSMMRQLRSKGSNGVVYVQALSDISLNLKQGDRLGLIGRNGAGKSTLLRVLAGLQHPQQGRVKLKGRVVPLIAKGLGMHHELSGLENIELPMRLLGASSAEVRAAKREIPEWTDLGDFIHLPIRTYSEGMRARLMFAVCTAVKGDILLMDEWLGAGDADFVQRAQDRLMEMVSASGIVVLSSHSMEIIRHLCNVVCWMDQGRIVLMGDPDTVIKAYLYGIQRPSPPSTQLPAAASF